jgi:hypothetical protein
VVGILKELARAVSRVYVKKTGLIIAGAGVHEMLECTELLSTGAGVC